MPLWRSVKNHLLPHNGNAHRPHILRRQWLWAFLGVALMSEALILGHAVAIDGPNVFLAAVLRSDVISFTAQARTLEGGSVLRESEVLNAAAQAKANDMAARGYFSHMGPQGEAPWTWLEGMGYEYLYAGENLAVKFNDSQRVVDAWMASPSHRANIVKPQYQEVGVGLAEGAYKGGTATFVVQFFASPAVAQAQHQPSGAGQAAVSVASPVAEVRVAEPPVVAGAETAVAAVQTTERAAAQIFEESHTVATWMLAAVAAILIVVLALTFFIRIQVQPTDLLLPGAAVAMVAITLLGVNAKLLPDTSQSASVIQSAPGDIGTAAFIERIQTAQP